MNILVSECATAITVIDLSNRYLRRVINISEFFFWQSRYLFLNTYVHVAVESRNKILIKIITRTSKY